MDSNIFWDMRRTMSYNRFLNFIVGNRGGGKTYGFKKMAIERFMNGKGQFAYIRRYQTELDSTLPTFFDDIAPAFPDLELQEKGGYFLINGEVAGKSFALSTAAGKKSISYPDITLIGFDEFLIEVGSYRYLKNEISAFTNQLETIIRMRDNVTVFCMANAISITNPYFLNYDLKMPKPGEIWRKNNLILVENVVNPEFVKAKQATRLGQLVMGTSEGEHIINNAFYLDDSTFIEPRSKNARTFMTLVYMGQNLGVWTDMHEGLVWVSEKYDPSAFTYALTTKDHKPNMLLVTANKSMFKRWVVEPFEKGALRFETMNIKNNIMQVMKWRI